MITQNVSNLLLKIVKQDSEAKINASVKFGKADSIPKKIRFASLKSKTRSGRKRTRNLNFPMCDSYIFYLRTNFYVFLRRFSKIISNWMLCRCLNIQRRNLKKTGSKLKHVCCQCKHFRRQRRMLKKFYLRDLRVSPSRNLRNYLFLNLFRRTKWE